MVKEIIGTTVVALILTAIVVLVIRKMIKDRKKGSGGCTGNCASCGCNCMHAANK